jgi:4-diphosphocytidyl-2-C-methyl-D-erythritol kinase
VRLAPSRITLTTNERRLPTDERNLVVKAARALAEAADVSLGAEFRLEKRIPTGAGMGGGSSDAAAALLLLDRLWDTRLSPARLARIAADLGSDCALLPSRWAAARAGARHSTHTLKPQAD